MNYERFTGILFLTSVSLFILFYLLSPQEKYAKPLTVEIPDIEQPVFDTSLLGQPVEDIDTSFESIDIPKDIGKKASAVTLNDFSMSLYRIGIFSSFEKASELLLKINQNGYMGEIKSLENDATKHAVYVIFFTEEEIKKNKSRIDAIAGIDTGVITPWMP